MAGLPRFRARACRVAPNESNVKVMESTRALLIMQGRPRRGFPDLWGRACAPRGNAGAVIPWCLREGPRGGGGDGSWANLCQLSLGRLFEDGHLLQGCVKRLSDLLVPSRLHLVLHAKQHIPYSEFCLTFDKSIVNTAKTDTSASSVTNHLSLGVAETRREGPGPMLTEEQQQILGRLFASAGMQLVARGIQHPSDDSVCARLMQIS